LQIKYHQTGHPLQKIKLANYLYAKMDKYGNFQTYLYGTMGTNCNDRLKVCFKSLKTKDLVVAKWKIREIREQVEKNRAQKIQEELEKTYKIPEANQPQEVTKIEQDDWLLAD